MIRCAAIDAIGPITHGFTTRRADGANGFDVGGPDPGDERAAGARRRAARTVGLVAEPVLLRQVHGTRLVDASRRTDPEEADGVLWTGGVALASPAVRTADCVPLLLAHTSGRAVAAVHVGWRGVARGMASRVVEELDRRGFSPDQWIAAVGPAIGPCCYEVGEDVAGAVLQAVAGNGAEEILLRPVPGGRPRLDLGAAVVVQLRAAGLTREGIEVSPWCTRCEADLFHSYRRDGERAGRMLAMVGPRARP